jgi:hypothetical protein
VETKLQAYIGAIAAVGTAVAAMNAARADLHAEIEAESDKIGKQVASDTAAKP